MSNKRAHDIPGNTVTPGENEPRVPKVGEIIYFGTHVEGDKVSPAPALVGIVRDTEVQENGLPTLDLFIFHPYRQQNGWVSHVKGFPKLRVGGWSLSLETDAEHLGTVEKLDTRPLNERLPKPEAPVDPTAPTTPPDPQTDGMPNIFGGMTRYNPAVNRQQHSNDRDQLLFICPTCKTSKWFDPKAKLSLDGGCCSEAIKRRTPGLQADPAWDLWKIPDDSVLVGKGAQAEAGESTQNTPGGA